MQIIHCSWPWPGNCVYITQTSYFVILQGLNPAGTFTLMKWIKTLCGIDSRSYIKLWRHWALPALWFSYHEGNCKVSRDQWSYIGWQNLNPQSHPNATLAPQARQARANYELLAEALVWHPKYDHCKRHMLAVKKLTVFLCIAANFVLITLFVFQVYHVICLSICCNFTVNHQSMFVILIEKAGFSNPSLQ